MGQGFRLLFRVNKHVSLLQVCHALNTYIAAADFACHLLTYFMIISTDFQQNHEAPVILY